MIKSRVFLAIYVITFFTLCLILTPLEQNLFDLRLYQNASWHYFQLKNPYQPFDSGLLTQSGLGEVLSSKQNFPVMSPPTTFLILLPIVIGSLMYSKIAFFTFCLFSILVSSFLLISVFNKEQENNFNKFLPLAFPYGSLIAIFTWGSFSCVCLLGLCLYIFFKNSGNNKLAGFSLILTLIKPHLFLLFYFYILIYSIKQKHFQEIIYFLLSVFIFSLLSFFYFPKSWIFYFDSIFNTNNPTGLINASIPKVISYFFSYNYIHVALLLNFLGIIFILLNFNKLKNQTYSIPLIIPFSIAFSPYAWSHDYILAFPILLLSISWNKSLKVLLLLLVYAGTFIIFALNYNYIFGYQFLYPQVLLTYLVFLNYRHFKRKLS